MRRTYKWMVTIGASAAIFGLCWWISDVSLGFETGNALGIAAVPGGLATTLLGWWAGRESMNSASAAPVTQRNELKVRRDEFNGLLVRTTPGVQSASGQLVVGPVPREPQHFQQPKQVMRALADAAHSGSMAVVCSVTGQRGIGKTQAAGAYARKRIVDGWLVAWISAYNEDLVETGLLELADVFGMRRSDDSAAAVVARLRNHLQTLKAPALLVFDNVTDPEYVTRYLPATGSAQIVLTSASHTLDHVGQSIPVNLFSPERAARFLKSITGLDDGPGARAVAEELGYLPLALAQAAARIVRTDRDFRSYLRAYRKLPVAQLLKARPGEPYVHGAAEAILLAVEPFERPGRAAELRLLELLSVLSVDGISWTLLEAIFGHSIGDRIEVLLDASLIDFAGANSSVVVMHRLTQRVIRDRARCSLSATLDDAVELIQRALSRERKNWDRSEIGDELVRHIDSIYVHFASMSNSTWIRTSRFPAWLRRWWQRLEYAGRMTAPHGWAIERRDKWVEREAKNAFILIESWKQVVYVQSNGDVKEAIAIEAVATRNRVYFVRFKSGSMWDQSERIQRSVRVLVRNLAINREEYVPCTVTNSWYPAGVLITILHFHEPIKKGEKIYLEIDRFWPGKAWPLMCDGASDSFFLRASSLLDVRNVEYKIVLPAGFEAVYKPIGQSEVNARLSIEVLRDSEERGVFIWRADRVPSERSIGIGLQLNELGQ